MSKEVSELAQKSPKDVIINIKEEGGWRRRV